MLLNKEQKISLYKFGKKLKTHSILDPGTKKILGLFSEPKLLLTESTKKKKRRKGDVQENDVERRNSRNLEKDCFSNMLGKSLSLIYLR